MWRHWFKEAVLARPWACFLMLGLSFLAFGAGTLNIASLLSANTRLVLDYGWQALMDGAARQLVELLVSVYIGLASWVVFKACELRLVQWLSGPPAPPSPPPTR